MQTKLTLRLEETLIRQAKYYAKQHQRSLSQVVADYFQILTHQQSQESEVPPITRSLLGMLDSESLGADDYKKYLEEKYL
ncbi:MAG: antitoxin [gamma proteobacterium symbiont of Bathyaustriella thionipta]|nr:antitoxin [gamma proteobacterium symbiont of Bathyaustriella thionipta]